MTFICDDTEQRMHMKYMREVMKRNCKFFGKSNISTEGVI